MKSANFEIVISESTKDKLVIRDLGPWDSHPTITNAAEDVVETLYKHKLLNPGRKLLYYDSEDNLDELVHKDGTFVSFKSFHGN